MRINERSRLIRPESPLEPKYPVFIEDARNEYRNVSFSSSQEEEMIAPFGYFPVLDTEVPTGDVVTEGYPKKRKDGKWYRSYDVREFTAEEKAEQLRSAKTEALMRVDMELDSIQGRTLDIKEGKVTHTFSLSIQGRQVLSEHVLLATLDPTLDEFFLRTANNINVVYTREQLFDVTKKVVTEVHRLQTLGHNEIDLINMVESIEDMPEPFVLPA